MENLNRNEFEEVSKYILSKIDKKPDFKEDARLEELANRLEETVFNSIKESKFSMLYQPKYEPDEQTTNSAEALFRCKYEFGEDDSTMINPEVAFYLFKQNKHEKDVVLKQIDVICGDMNKNKIVKANPDYKMSVNVSLDCLDQEFVDKFKASIKENKLQPKNFQIEILETEDFSTIDKYKPIISELKNYGVSFALDDFGSRNAKDLSVVELLDFDEVKIDRDVLRDGINSNDYHLLREYYEHTKKVLPNATIVVEGVEGLYNKETGTYTVPLSRVTSNLKRIGAMNYQGYGFKKPQSAKDLGKILEEQNEFALQGFGS